MTGIATAFQTIKSNSFYEMYLILTASIWPFVHIIYGVNDTEGLFGYSYMSSFLNAFGRVVFMLNVARWIKFIVKTKVIEEHKKSVSMVGNMFLYVGCFFLFAILIPKKMLFGTPDFPPYFYWLSMGLLCLTGTYVFNLINKAIGAIEQKLIERLSKAENRIDSLTKNRNSLLELVGYYRKDVAEPLAKSVDNDFKQQAKELLRQSDDKLVETIEKMASENEK